MTSVEDVLHNSGYSPKAIALYLHKTNVGTCADANVCYGYTGPCGDTMEFFLNIGSDSIHTASFQAIGCEGAFICGSAVTEMIKGMHVEDAERIEQAQVIEYIGGLPEEKYDCARLAVITLRKALEEFRRNQT